MCVKKNGKKNHEQKVIYFKNNKNAKNMKKLAKIILQLSQRL